MAYKSKQRRNVQTAWRWDSTTVMLLLLALGVLALAAVFAMWVHPASD
jgi:hypothetical protein